MRPQWAPTSDIRHGQSLHAKRSANTMVLSVDDDAWVDGDASLADAYMGQYERVNA